MYPKKDIKVKKVQSNNDPTKVRNMKHVNFVPKTIQTEVLYARNRLCHFCLLNPNFMKIHENPKKANSHS